MVLKNNQLGVKKQRILTPFVKTLYFCDPKKRTPSPIMEKMQFCAAVIMTLLTLTLVLLPKREDVNPVTFRARWFMAGGIGILALQFVFQIILGLRRMGVAQAVMLNLFMFVPATWLLNLGVLYLQRKDKLHRREWLAGLLSWIMVTILLFFAQYNDRDPYVFNGLEIPIEEIIGSLIYLAMQCHYTYLHFRELRRMHRALSNYYDRDMSTLLNTMERAIESLAIVAVFAPQAIFNSGWVLGVFGLLSLLGIYYFVISYIVFVYSASANQLSVAEQNDESEDEEENIEVKPHASEMSDSDRERIGATVERWIANNGHLRSGITIQNAADEMKIPRYQLTAWLKTTEQELFSPWLTHLRIEEAKRQMIDHPEWSNDVIAEHCGFGSRSYFQTVFHKQTGMTPSAFIESQKR